MTRPAEGKAAAVLPTAALASWGRKHEVLGFIGLPRENSLDCRFIGRGTAASLELPSFYRAVFKKRCAWERMVF